MSDTCGERMQICKVLMVQAGAWVIFKLKCIPEKATVVSEGAVRKDLNEEKKKNTILLHRTFIQFHTAF